MPVDKKEHISDFRVLPFVQNKSETRSEQATLSSALLGRGFIYVQPSLSNGFVVIGSLIIIKKNHKKETEFRTKEERALVGSLNLTGAL